MGVGVAFIGQNGGGGNSGRITEWSSDTTYNKGQITFNGNQQLLTDVFVSRIDNNKNNPLFINEPVFNIGNVSKTSSLNYNFYATLGPVNFIGNVYARNSDDILYYSSPTGIITSLTGSVNEPGGDIISTNSGKNNYLTTITRNADNTFSTNYHELILNENYNVTAFNTYSVARFTANLGEVINDTFVTPGFVFNCTTEKLFRKGGTPGDGITLFSASTICGELSPKILNSIQTIFIVPASNTDSIIVAGISGTTLVSQTELLVPNLGNYEIKDLTWIGDSSNYYLIVGVLSYNKLVAIDITNTTYANPVWGKITSVTLSDDFELYQELDVQANDLGNTISFFLNNGTGGAGATFSATEYDYGSGTNPNSAWWAQLTGDNVKETLNAYNSSSLIISDTLQYTTITGLTTDFGNTFAINPSSEIIIPEGGTYNFRAKARFSGASSTTISMAIYRNSSMVSRSLVVNPASTTNYLDYTSFYVAGDRVTIRVLPSQAITLNGNAFTIQGG